jgi:hypothetical protein
VSDTLHHMMLGALIIVCLVAAVQFLKFWRLSHGWFFIFFALAFLIFSVGYLIRSLTNDVAEQTYAVYLPRLFGFLLILYAIFDKNRRAST